MEITEVKVFPVSDRKLRAFVSIVFDGSFIVNDIKVISGKDGLFISMPSRRKKNGRFKDIAHPLNNETRQAMEERIIAAYRRVVEEGGGEAREGAPEAAAERPDEGAAAAPARAEEESRPATGAAEAASESPPPAAGEGGAGDDDAEEKSLEEVHEAHLSDSYWTS